MVDVFDTEMLQHSYCHNQSRPREGHPLWSEVHRSPPAANLFLVHLKSISILHFELVKRLYISLVPKVTVWCEMNAIHGGHAIQCAMATYSIGCVCGLNALAVEEEAHGLDVLALALAEGRHELLELCGPLDLEEDLVVVVCDLDVEVLGRRSSALVALGSTVIGHFRRGAG